jgi:DNA-binding response OmpR family regulator
MKILVVEDDKKISDFIVKGLQENQCQALCAYDGIEALDILSTEEGIDLIVLDVMMPRLDGLGFLQTIRRNNNLTPVIILSAKRSVEEKVEGLQFGADDYLEKPFSFSELYARIQVIHRRFSKEAIVPLNELSFKDLKLDLISRVASRGSDKIELQAKEFLLLEYLLKNPGRVITKTMILEKVYGYHFDTQTNVVDVLVHRLRAKIDHTDEKLIHTVRGVGYVLKD